MKKLCASSGSIRWVGATFAVVAAILTAPANGFSQQLATKSSLDWLDSWTCVLANTETLIHFHVPNSNDQPTLVQWMLVANDRTLRRGTQPTSIELVNNQKTHAFTLRTPPLKPAVTIEIELRIRLANKPKSPWLTKKLTVYSDRVIEEKVGLEKDLKISLYDPMGATAKILDKSGFAYQRVASIAALDQLDGGTLVVGEGISFNQQRGLSASLKNAAKRGAFVFCMAPSDGKLSIMEDEGDDARLLKVSLAQENILLRFDKRFDTKLWVTGTPTTTRYEVASSPATTSLSFKSSPSGWCWFEADFASSQPNKRRGRLVVCSFQLVAHWEQCPIPRYLFVGALKNSSDTRN